MLFKFIVNPLLDIRVFQPAEVISNRKVISRDIKG